MPWWRATHPGRLYEGFQFIQGFCPVLDGYYGPFKSTKGPLEELYSVILAGVNGALPSMLSPYFIQDLVLPAVLSVLPCSTTAYDIYKRRR
jgi:hypothetical protein